MRHEHYPILITQRFIDTSKHAETIYIKDLAIIQEYTYKLEQTYREVTILREKISWFEREHSSMEGIIANLRGQLGDIGSYQTQITQYQQQITIYQQEISSLRSQLQQHQSSGAGHQSQISQYQTEINTLKQRISQLEAQLAHQSGLGGELAGLKQQLNIYIT